MLIKDGQQLTGAKTRYGYTIPIYDDGFGDLYVMRDSLGIRGIVRAQSWETAYEICEDEFFPEADETGEEMEREYSTVYMSGRELWLHEHNDDWNAWQALPEADKREAYMQGKDLPYIGDVTEHACWQEAYGFRPNGANTTDKRGHGIYAKDLNGDYLDKLTTALAAELEIALEIVGEAE